MSKAKNLHPPQSGIPLFARLPNFPLGLSWSNPPPLCQPYNTCPIHRCFPCAWVPCLTSMKCLHADGSDRLPQQPSLCLSSSPLVCSGPLMGRASQRKAFAAHKHHGLDQGDLQSLALMMEGICSPLIPASSPFCGCVPKRAG